MTSIVVAIVVRAITLCGAIWKRSNEQMFKTNTKKETKGLRFANLHNKPLYQNYPRRKFTNYYFLLNKICYLNIRLSCIDQPLDVSTVE